MTTSLVENIVVLGFLLFEVMVADEAALVVEGAADVWELEDAEVLMLEGAPEVDETAEL